MAGHFTYISHRGKILLFQHILAKSVIYYFRNAKSSAQQFLIFHIINVWPGGRMGGKDSMVKKADRSTSLSNYLQKIPNS